MGLKELWDNFINSGLTPGVHVYNGFGDLAHHRFHLRVDTDEKGVLIADASKLIFLNGTALDYVRCMLEGKSDGEAYSYMKGRYKKLDKATAVEHFKDVKDKVVKFIHGDQTVIENIGTDSTTIGTDELPAPYRMDLALTYSCQNDCLHCYNETKDKKEMDLKQWQEVLDKLWKVGVPHVVFTGGEPTLKPMLRDLIIKSESLGQITGLITNGRVLGKKGYLKDLVKVGLDHVQITVLSHQESVHDKLVNAKGAWKETIAGLKVALTSDLYVQTNTTIMKSNSGEVEETLRFLISLGVKNAAFNGIIRSGKGKNAEGITYEELTKVLTKLKGIADREGVKMVWYTPTPYCEFNPVNYGFGIKQCTACAMNMAIEPDGKVIPCQSYYKPLGNILTDNWDTIWKHKLAQEIRHRKYIAKKCKECKLMQVCGGGCPLSVKSGDYMCLDRHSSM